MIPKTAKQHRHSVRQTLASVQANLAAAIAKLTYYDSVQPTRTFTPPMVVSDIFCEVDEAWAELNKLHADLDEGKIRLG